MDAIAENETGVRIKQVLRSKGLLQSELSREVGVSKATISNLCSGVTQRINSEFLFKIAKFIGVSAEWLLTGEDLEIQARDSERGISTLLPVSLTDLDGEGISTVNARELHEFLEVGDKFANWIKDRIEKFEFVENQDFVSFSENSEKPKGGRPLTEYHLTLDMAKELSMVERNPQGKQARRYFIRCEKRLHDSSRKFHTQQISNQQISNQQIQSIINGIVGQITVANTGAITVAITAAMKEIMPELAGTRTETATAMDSRTRSAILEKVSVRQVLDSEKVPSKKRRGLILLASHSLRDFCIQVGATSKRCARTRTWLFPVEVISQWLKQVGRTLIADHQHALHGQLTLNLVPMIDAKRDKVN